MRELLQYTSRFKRMYQKSFQMVGERLRLSQMEIDILLFLYNNPKQNTARDVVAYRGFAKSNVSKGVEHLERMGWLKVEPDSDSRRVKRLVFRSERMDDLAELSECQHRCLEAIFADFTPQDRELLAGLLARMDANVQKYLKTLEQGENE
ncbi:MAG: MarR family transcriptional regulator [Clostridiales bacterium]|nr:MarR family transcriptional regulator [Clostridiales bacterium]